MKIDKKSVERNEDIEKEIGDGMAGVVGERERERYQGQGGTGERRTLPKKEMAGNLI